MASDEQAVSVKLALKYTEKDYNPVNWLAFNEGDEKEKVELSKTLAAFTSEMFSKFLYNLEHMSKRDEFVNELNELGVDGLINLYNKAYSELN